MKIYKVLVDLSHGEKIHTISETFFKDKEVLFFFTSPTDILDELEELEKYDLIMMIKPKPEKKDVQLFHPRELITLKKYIARGGRLLLTSGSHGDFDLPRKLGSLKVFYKITGILQYYNGMLFHPHPSYYLEKKTILKLRSFPLHPVFAENYKELIREDYENIEEFRANFKPLEGTILMRRATYFDLDPEQKDEFEFILRTPPYTYFHDFYTKTKNRVDKVPVAIGKYYRQGKVVVLGSSSFLLKEPWGYNHPTNLRFMQNVIDWLLQEE